MRSRVFPLISGLLLFGTLLQAELLPPAQVRAGSAFAEAQKTSAIRWQAWTDATLARAQQQKKPVYVFIGSPLSELTRATINQTFASEKTVEWLNENFFCLFVDADAQPEVAAYGQHFINSVKQLRGQPVHLWLTPDTLQPYDGANYLPPSEEWGQPGYLKSARTALDTWTTEPERARALAAEALEMMKPLPLGDSPMPDLKAKLDRAAAAWIATIDPKHGGFGTAPKLPEPELIRFLLTRDQPAQDAAINAARALVNGAARDPVDGGFYRRCIDDEWKEPYHQKTLADQARIALALFEAADVAKDDKLRSAGIAALDFALKELRNPDGTFAAALDGTLEEDRDPLKRPKFSRVGSANTFAQGLLIVALTRSGDPRLVAASRQVAGQLPRAGSTEVSFVSVKHSADSTTLATPADLLATVLAGQALGERENFPLFLAVMNVGYFVPTVGAYMAIPLHEAEELGAIRVPASGDTPSAEVLALLAGVDEKTAALIRRALLTQIEYDELPPGDILLGLSQGLK